MTATGRFVWFEYQAPAAEHAVLRGFYEGVLDWGRGGDPGYAMWTARERPVAAIVDGAPPLWIGYVQVPSVDRTLEHAARLGGAITTPATDIPDMGRYAVLRDPFGAVIGVYQSAAASSDGAPPDDGLGTIEWAETHSTDAHAAARFYSELFGWVAIGELPAGSPTAVYLTLGTEPGKARFGISNMAGEMKAPPHWVYYVKVAGAQAAIDAAKRLGGRHMYGPMPAPDGHQIAACFDPQGVMFGLIQPRG